MKGQRHADHLASATFLGSRTPRSAYRLVLIDYYPAMVSGGTTAISGELYDVSSDTLELLDELEEHPAFYQREQILLLEGESAWCYLLPVQHAQGADTIEGGDFRSCPLAL